MANFPEMFIPLMFAGYTSFWCETAQVTIPAGTTISLTHGPPVDKIVYLYFLTDTGRPRRTDTDEVIRSTDVYLEYWLLPFTPEITAMPVKRHKSIFLESFYTPDHPFVVWSTDDKPMEINLINNETYDVSWDFTLWILECAEQTFEDIIRPYGKGWLNYYKAFSDPEAATGMVEFYKMFADPSFRQAYKTAMTRLPAARPIGPLLPQPGG